MRLQETKNPPRWKSFFNLFSTLILTFSKITGSHSHTSTLSAPEQPPQREVFCQVDNRIFSIVF